MEGTGAAAALNQREHGPTIAITALLLPAIPAVELPRRPGFFVADECLVNFQRLALAAYRGEHVSKRGHRLANAMRHEPGRLVGNAENAMELMAAEALLA